MKRDWICLGQDSYPLWKVFCSGVPLYRGRLDSLIRTRFV